MLESGNIQQIGTESRLGTGLTRMVLHPLASIGRTGSDGTGAGLTTDCVRTIDQGDGIEPEVGARLTDSGGLIHPETQFRP